MNYLEFLDVEVFQKIDFKKSYLEDLKIRIDNGQSYFTVAILALFKFIKNFQRFF